MRPRLFEKLDAIHVRHQHICDQQVDAFVFDYVERLDPVPTSTTR